jgi:LacI family repressor for deo operon, udp, cdd, tsx, nupC, and nupG
MTKPILPYKRVRQFVLNQISSGNWKTGMLIPSEVQLAGELSVHRLTVNRVLTDFARDGIMVRRRGVGTTLLEKPKPKLSGTQKTVGLISGHHFDPVTNPYYGVIFEKLRKILKTNGVYLIPLGDATDYLENKSAPVSSVEDFSAIAMLGGPESARAMQQFEQCGCPAMIIGMSEYEGPLPHVATEDEEDAALVARKLLGLGHRLIVHINAIPPKRLQSKLQGLLQACEQEGHSMPFRYIVEARGLEMRDGKEAMLEFLKRGLPFTAVFGATDNLALGAMSALRESGILIPEQVSVVGFDGIESALHSSPPLATMRVSRTNMAKTAADCLLALCSGRPAPENNPPLRAEWIEGATLGPPPH